MTSILQRFRNAGNALIGKQHRATSHEFQQFFQHAGQPHTFKPHESLAAYGDNPWLHSAVDVVSSEVSRTRFFLESKKGDAWEQVEAHDALETLKNPIPMAAGKSHLTQRQMFYLLSQHQLLNGEGFWMLDGRRKLNGSPTIVEPLLPANVNVHYSKGGTVSHFTYKTGDREIRIEPEDIVHFKTVNPQNWFRGHAPTQSIRYALDAAKEADKLNLYRIKNNAVPSGILSSEQKIDDTERKRYVQAWKQMYGGAENGNKVAFLPQGVSFDKVQETNADMQYAEAKEWNRDEILANFRVGLEMLGRTESQTRSNAESAIFVFERFVVLPMLDMVCDTLNNDYLSQFAGTDNLRFSFPDPVPENTEEKRQNISVLMDNGALTPDEARQQMGLEPLNIKGVTDIPYMSFNKVPSTSPPNLAAA